MNGKVRTIGASTPERSRIMRAIKSSGTGPERRVAEWFKKARLKPTLNDATLPGKPDFVFRRRRTAIFVHGCFWHGHKCKRGARAPVTNAEYWANKIVANRQRDRAARRLLRQQGWRVFTIWECQISSEAKRAWLIAAIRG